MKVDRAKVKSMFDGRCAYCGTILGEKWHIDHIKPVLRTEGDIEKQNDGTYKYIKKGIMTKPENHHADNFYPACVACNIHKGGSSVEGFRWRLKDHIQMLNKASNHSIYRHAKRFGLVKETGAEVVFYFEQKAGE